MKTLLQILTLIISLKCFGQTHKLHSINTEKKAFVIKDLKNKESNRYHFNFQVKGDFHNKIFNPDNNQMYYLKTSFIGAKRLFEKTIQDVHVYESSKNEQFIVYLKSNQIANN